MKQHTHTHIHTYTNTHTHTHTHTYTHTHTEFSPTYLPTLMLMFSLWCYSKCKHTLKKEKKKRRFKFSAMVHLVVLLTIILLAMWLQKVCETDHDVLGSYYRYWENYSRGANYLNQLYGYVDCCYRTFQCCFTWILYHIFLSVVLT